MAEIKKITLDKKLDVFEAYFTEEEPKHPLNVVEGSLSGHVLFEVDSVTNELVKITIYDYSVVRRTLMRKYIILLTKQAVINWLNEIADSFNSGSKHQLVLHN